MDFIFLGGNLLSQQRHNISFSHLQGRMNPGSVRKGPERSTFQQSFISFAALWRGFSFPRFTLGLSVYLMYFSAFKVLLLGMTEAGTSDSDAHKWLAVNYKMNFYTILVKDLIRCQVLHFWHFTLKISCFDYCYLYLLFSLLFQHFSFSVCLNVFASELLVYFSTSAFTCSVFSWLHLQLNTIFERLRVKGFAQGPNSGDLVAVWLESSIFPSLT